MKKTSAFPLPPDRDVYNWEKNGMTLRDYFAAKAMAALISNPITDDWGHSDISEKAYKYADAMLKIREQE